MVDLVRENWKWFLIEGILLVFLGVLSIALPTLSTLSIELVIGWLLVFGGAVQAFRTLRDIHAEGSYLSLLNAAIYVIIGLLMLFYPVRGILTLTLLLSVFFIIEGIFKIAVAFQWRPLRNWGWVAISGALSLVLGGIILSGWPGTAAWAIGLLFGINMLFLGWTMILVSMGARASQ